MSKITSKNYGKRYTTEYWARILYREYVGNKNHISDIASKYNCSAWTVCKYLKLLNIKKRKKNAYRTGTKHSEETKRKMAEAIRGRKSSKETRRKVSLAGIGRKWTESQRDKFIKTFKANKSNRGKIPWNWQGKSSVNTRLRKSAQYKEWRLAVYQRDGFKCVGCGDNRGGNLQAHHKLSFAKYPKERFNVGNGVTLCNECHAAIHPDLKFVKSPTGAAVG